MTSKEKNNRAYKMTVNRMFLPYNMASELDRHYASTGQGLLDVDEYFNVVETITATGHPNHQEACFELFKRLPKNEVVRRSAIVVRLSNLLTTIRFNYMKPNDISRTSKI